ncbi:hypothetical protein PE066_17565 [Ramlibacter tataouinensis]|uniref:hypothetical protein n=1 Tax=Ramlibacter tataouinensis TaxID=94132 RepID=UPI0022F3B1C5|nr:hypothetical protein [Ramlibacter tataouinensis]WBY01249.1 hypothetical protein PE066_17565 [Ramlibacter tataouinensis]
MQLDYLLFDFTDEESGSGSFDAMAWVLPERVPALLGEIEAVLGWGHQAFGPPDAAVDAGSWDFDLQGASETDDPLGVTYDAASGRVILLPSGSGGGITLALTVGGSRDFCEVFRQAFTLD